MKEQHVTGSMAAVFATSDESQKCCQMLTLLWDDRFFSISISTLLYPISNTVLVVMPSWNYLRFVCHVIECIYFQEFVIISYRYNSGKNSFIPILGNPDQKREMNSFYIS